MRMAGLMDPGYSLERIEHLWAWISFDESGEGVCAFVTQDGLAVPLIAADEVRLRSMRPQAERIAKMSGKPVRLVQFTTRRDIEVIQP
jgi:hypothetical protein